MSHYFQFFRLYFFDNSNKATILITINKLINVDRISEHNIEIWALCGWTGFFA